MWVVHARPEERSLIPLRKRAHCLGSTVTIVNQAPVYPGDRRRVLDAPAATAA